MKMLGKLGKLRKKLKEKKGFTLVELIVVIVIIGILAALLVPSILKYIEKAREQQTIADARTVYVATQTAVAQAYADGVSITTAGGDVLTSTDGAGTGSGGFSTAVDGKSIAEIIVTDAGIKKSYTVNVVISAGQITGEFTYSETGGMTFEYDGTKWTKQ